MNCMALMAQAAETTLMYWGYLGPEVLPGTRDEKEVFVTVR